jgi:hypothetical protein
LHRQIEFTRRRAGNGPPVLFSEDKGKLGAGVLDTVSNEWCFFGKKGDGVPAAVI